MKTTISFVDKKQNYLLTIEHDANPIDTYKVGDKLYLEVDTIVYPKTKDELHKKYKQVFVDRILKSHKEQCENLNKYFKIISKHQTIRQSINCSWEFSQTIEYTVKETEMFRWKWWYIKYRLKKLFNGSKKR